MSIVAPYRQLLSESGLYTRQDNEQTAPELRARLHARVHQSPLDRRIADGEDTNDGDQLQVRAWQLTRPRACERLATALEMILSDLDHRRVRPGARVPACREEVEVARGEMTRAAERLRDPRPVKPRGVVLVRELLSNGYGPLFVPSANDELWRQMRRAAVALD